MKKNNPVIVFAVKIFMYIHQFFHYAFNINIKGAGFFYKFLNNEDYFRFGDKYLFYNPAARGSYARLINGVYNETETHIFLRNLLSKNREMVFSLIEVGGNVGEFLIDFGGERQIEKFFIFEPQSECVLSLNKTIEKNCFKNVTLIPKAAYETDGYITFEISESFSSSHIDEEGKSGFKVETVSIDSMKFDFKNIIMLLDAEGAELKIIKGAKQLIKNNNPLIIFEYNYITRQYFKIDDVKRELGDDYTIYRLTPSGSLDENFKGRIWNLVAINKNGFFKI